MKRLFKVIKNFIMLFIFLASLTLIARDLICWAIIPFFSGEFMLFTYFGFFTELAAYWCLITSYEYLKAI